MTAIILYGPPASGKDTVTRHLGEIDSNYRLFERLKVGPGRLTGYRVSTLDRVNQLRAAGEIVWENERYSAQYVIDRPALLALHRIAIPVVHLGQVEAVDAVRQALDDDVLTVALWCPRDVAAERIAERATGDDAARLDAWDATEPLYEADIRIDTSEVAPETAARLIHELRAARPA